MRILLIEDDEILTDQLLESLTSQHYVVDAIADGRMGWEYAQDTPYDLIVMDVGLPGLDGITLCERLRAEGCTTPILLMTAKDAPQERVRGLDAGADDHLTKPLNLEELQARVRALLRRGEVHPETVLEMGLLRFDPVRCQVTYGGVALKLTPKEYSLLELFLRHPGRVFSRSHIIEHLWSFDDPPLEDSVKAHIKGLRRKLKEAGAVDWIENVYGIGYRFDPARVDLAPTGAIAPPPALSPDPMPGSSSGRVQPHISAASPSHDSPSSSLEQTFHNSMDSLWEKYQDLMAQRLNALQQAATTIPAGDLSATTRQAAIQAAHKLAGVLGMFEREEGTALARDLEKRLEAGSASELAAVPHLVEQLAQMLSRPNAPLPAPVEPIVPFLLVSTDNALMAGLQALEPGGALPWQQVNSLAAAIALLQHTIPAVVVVDIAAAAQWQDSLEFLRQLAARTPALPTLALATVESLVDRVAIARTGIHQLLLRPVTPGQVWEAAQRIRQQSQTVTGRVLVVDDDPLILKALRPLLEPWGMVVTGLENPQSFWEVLQATTPDLLILDVEMPGFSGIDLCQAVRTDPRWQNLPVLFLTAHRDSLTIQQVYGAGADDYISKPIVGPELLARILNRLERGRLLQTLSHRDPLTGLLNYPGSKQALHHLIDLAHTRGTPLAFVLLRVADLAAIALQYGHDAAHQILQRWGQCLQATLRGQEVLGYWGNGEFVIGLPDLSPTEAAEYLAPLFQTLRRQIITLTTEERLQPEFVAAIATYPTDGLTLQALYQFASRSA